MLFMFLLGLKKVGAYCILTLIHVLHWCLLRFVTLNFDSLTDLTDEYPHILKLMIITVCDSYL